MIPLRRGVLRLNDALLWHGSFDPTDGFHGLALNSTILSYLISTHFSRIFYVFLTIDKG